MSMDWQDIVHLTRRDFLVNAARGVGGVAFASLLKADGLLAAGWAQVAGAAHTVLVTHAPPWETELDRVKEGAVRRAKLYYLRGLASKAIRQKTNA